MNICFHFTNMLKSYSIVFPASQYFFFLDITSIGKMHLEKINDTSLSLN